MALHQAPEEDQNSVLKEIAKHKARKTGRTVAKKLVKKGAKLAVNAALKVGAGLTKLLISLLGYIGLPVLLIFGSIIVLVLIISLAFSFFFGTGEGIEGEDKELHNYIVSRANATVDMSNNFQKRYRVPHELIASVIQLDVMSSKSNSEIKNVIKEMAAGLKPDFQTDKFNEWKETKQQVCEDGVCGEWSKPVKTDNFVEKYTHVDYWNGYTAFTYSPYVTDWKKDVKITYRDEKYKETETRDVIEYRDVARRVVVKVPYKTYVYIPYPDNDGYLVCCEKVERTLYRDEYRIVYDRVPHVVQKEFEVEKTRRIEIKTITMTRYQRFNSSKNDTEDYSHFDTFLNSHGLGMNDKKLLEINYEFIGGTINYTNWLSQYGGNYGGNYGGFTGTITPGAGVPTQYMEFYRGAEQKYGVPWYTLAAVHFVETGYGTHPTMVSSAGALGHMQVRP